MAYESKIIFLHRFEGFDSAYTMELARIKCGSIESHIINAFDKEIDFKLYGDRDADLTIDPYGKRCTYCTLPELAKALEEPYTGRRVKVLSKMVDGFMSEDFKDMDIIAVHYGY